MASNFVFSYTKLITPRKQCHFKYTELILSGQQCTFKYGAHLSQDSFKHPVELIMSGSSVVSFQIKSSSFQIQSSSLPQSSTLLKIYRSSCQMSFQIQSLSCQIALPFKYRVYNFRYQCPFKYKTNFFQITFFFVFLGGIFFFLFIQYSALLHLPPLRFHCADGCWDRTQDRCNSCIGSQTL